MFAIAAKHATTDDGEREERHAAMTTYCDDMYVEMEVVKRAAEMEVDTEKRLADEEARKKRLEARAAEMEVVKRAAALTRMDMEMEEALTSTRDMDPSATRSDTPDKGCCFCFCQACSCCTRPLAQGLLALLHTEVEALVKHKVQERLAALSASTMARSASEIEALVERKVQERLAAPSALTMAHSASEIEALVERKVQERLAAPSALTMARSASEVQGQIPTPPSHDTIPTPPSHFTIPKGTALALKSKAAFKIQHAFRVSRASLARHVCMTIKELPEADKAAAKSFNATLDSIRMVVMASALGTAGFRRAVCNTPEWWEEEELVSALRDVMSAPERSPFLFLFARPTRAEHALLSLASDVARRDLEE